MLRYATLRCIVWKQYSRGQVSGFLPPTRNEHDISRFIFLPSGPTLKCSKVNEDLAHADGWLDGKFSSCGNRRNSGKGRGVGKQPRKKEGKVL